MDELKLSIEPVRNKTVIAFHWSPDRLILDFGGNLFLRLASTLAGIDVAVTHENRTTNEQAIFVIPFSEEIIEHWNPLTVPARFAKKEFVDIYLSRRAVWLYFRKSEKLIEVMQTPVREYPVPILHCFPGV